MKGSKMYTDMTYQPLINLLHNYTDENITVEKLAEILMIPKSKMGTLYARIRRNSFFTPLEVKTLVEYYQESRTHDPATQQDNVEITYYSNPNLVTNIKTSVIKSIWFDRKFAENIWRKNPINLRVMTMLGDKMDSGAYPLRKDDVLIIDISDTDVTKAGVYAFTTHNDTYMFINGINRRFDGAYRFYFYNTIYPEKILTQEDVEKADIKIVGRVVKNLSLTI